MSIPRNIEAVVFDFDGVLFDSMANHAEAYRRLFAEFDCAPVEEREVFLVEGENSAGVIRRLAEARGLDWCDDAAYVSELSERKQAIFAELPERPFYEGALDTVRAVRDKGYPLGLVTGTHPDNVDRFLGDDKALFAVIVTGHDVENTKPHPEPYTTAMDALGVAPGATLVVENAPLGIQAAQAAGAHVAAVTTTLPAEDVSAADVVLSDVRDVPKLLPGAGADADTEEAGAR